MTTITFDSRVKGALSGAVIGAGLAFSRTAQPQQFELDQPHDVLGLTLNPADNMPEVAGRIDTRILTPFINLGVQAYLTKGGRATPEDFVVLLKNDADIAAPCFFWDPIHTTQEILKEGMHPRLSGLGNAPCGIICCAMPAVGIYHFNDPDYAYLDGVELASVNQPRLGADWAGLSAAAVAAAFDEDNDGDPNDIIAAVMSLAHQNNKPLFYQINNMIRAAGWMSGDEEKFAAWWMNDAGRGGRSQDELWPGFNPLRFVLPLLPAFSHDARKFMNLLVCPQTGSWMDTGHPAAAVIGGAVLGALRGEGIFPPEWHSWAEPITTPWYGIIDLVKDRVKTEQAIIADTRQMLETKVGDISQLQDKIYGCILAGAIGNAMGSPVEGKLYPEIDKEFPKGITTVLEPRRLESEDDNQMAMLLVETYLERNGLPVMARHFGETWKTHLNRDHFYIMCMGNCYDMVCAGWDARVTGHWGVVTGSTVMCMEPVGAYHLADPEFAAIDATAISYMYQRGLDVIAASMMAATTAEALRPAATVETVLQAALNAAPKTQLLTFDKRVYTSAYDYISACLDIAGKYTDVLAARQELYEKCLQYHMIDPLELWGFALAMFKIAKGDVRQAAIGGTNIGRDSDTIAGRAAMLSGALHGASTVPQEWMNLFKPEVLERIKLAAGHFAELIARKNLKRLAKRQIG